MEILKVKASQFSNNKDFTAGSNAFSYQADCFQKLLKQLILISLKNYLKFLLQNTGTIILFSGRKAGRSPKNTGSQATDILLINAVIPVIFVYGRSRDRQDICERALDFLENIEAEENIIIHEWKTAGIDAESAFYSQALIQLRNEYCKKRRCLDCRIGSKLISQGRKLKDQNELILEP